jgi:predicted nuclease with TOPRIM domain
MSAYIKRTERSQINDLMLHLKLLEKQEQAKPKTSRRKQIKKIRTKINEIEKNIQRINETKSCFFEKVNKIDRSLANLTKMRGEKTQISKIRNAKGEIATNTTEIPGIIRDYFENLYSNTFENCEEMDRFLDT